MSRCVLRLLLVLTLSVTATTYAAENEALPDPIIAIADFIEAHLVGKTVEASSTEKLADGRIETEFVRRTMFLPVRRNDDKLEFDQIVVFKQKIWDLDKEGKRLDKPPLVTDRISVGRIRLKTMDSTGEVVGYDQAISSSSVNPPISATPCRVKFTDGKLTIKSTTPLYDDAFDKHGKHRPSATDAERVYWVEGGKIHGTYKSKSYSVDPETLKRNNLDSEINLEETEVEGVL